MRRLWGKKDNYLSVHLFVVEGENPPLESVGATGIIHRPTFRTSEVISPFGTFIYDTNEAPFIAGQLHDLAQIIERGHL